MKSVFVATAFIATFTLGIPHVTFCHASPKVLTSITPEGLLPDGVDAAEVTNPFTKEKGFVRKGTIAAFLTNIAQIDDLLSQPETADTLEQLDDISATILKSIPNVKIVGLFDLFSPAEWTNSKHFKGRLLAITHYYKTYPDMMTQDIKDMLSDHLTTVTSPYLKKVLRSLLENPL